MSERVKVSVVVVTYNQDGTIGRTLDSILMQERDFPIEIIIGDDASTDGTEKVCREYAEKYPEIIRYIRNDRNRGVMDNYYDCLLLARGEYIADVAGDDFWIDNEKLKKQVEVLDNNPNTVLVCTDWKNYDVASGEFKSPWTEGGYPYRDWFSDKELTYKLLTHTVPTPVHLCTSLYRKKSFLQLYEEDPFVFRNKEFVVEDLQLTVMLSTIGEIKYLDVSTLAYSVHEGSLTGTKDFLKLFDLYFGAIKLTRYLADKAGIDQKRLEYVYRGFIHYLTMQAFHAYDKTRMEKIKGLIKEWNLSLNLKTGIITRLTNSPKVWLISKNLWQSIRKRH